MSTEARFFQLKNEYFSVETDNQSPHQRRQFRAFCCVLIHAMFTSQEEVCTKKIVEVKQTNQKKIPEYIFLHQKVFSSPAGSFLLFTYILYEKKVTTVMWIHEKTNFYSLPLFFQLFSSEVQVSKKNFPFLPVFHSLFFSLVYFAITFKSQRIETSVSVLGIKILSFLCTYFSSFFKPWLHNCICIKVYMYTCLLASGFQKIVYICLSSSFLFIRDSNRGTV